MINLELQFKTSLVPASFNRTSPRIHSHPSSSSGGDPPVQEHNIQIDVFVSSCTKLCVRGETSPVETSSRGPGTASLAPCGLIGNAVHNDAVDAV